MALLRRLLETAEPLRWKVTVDGEDRSGDYLAVEVLNTPFVGPSVPLSADADPGDGLLDVVTVRASDRHALIRYCDERLEHIVDIPPTLRVDRGRHVVFTPPPEVSLRVDDSLWPAGEAQERTSRRADSVEVTLRSGAVEVLVGT